MKYDLNPYERFSENLLFWISKYLFYKSITLSNLKADRKELEEAMASLRKFDPKEEDALARIKKISMKIQKAGVGVQTQFFPVWKFADWTSKSQGIAKMEDIGEDTVLEFLTVETSGKSDATKVNYKNALSNFFHYVSRRNKAQYAYDIDLKAWQRGVKNAAKRQPDFLNEEEIDRFFRTLDEADFSGKRKTPETAQYQRLLYSFLFRLIFLTGARIGEALDLAVKDLEIEEKDGTMRVKIRKGKGNKERVVPIPYDVERFDWGIEESFKNYMRARAEVLEKEKRTTPLLLVDEKGAPLYRKKADIALRKILFDAGISKKKSGPHLLRHTNASLLYRRTDDILLVKERLGHESVQVTERYTHLNDEQIQKGVKAFG